MWLGGYFLFSCLLPLLLYIFALKLSNSMSYVINYMRDKLIRNELPKENQNLTCTLFYFLCGEDLSFKLV